MKRLAVAALAAVLFATPLSADAALLEPGDRLELPDGRSFTVAKLRTALRDQGYYAFAQGDHTGHIIKITAYGPDRRPYRLRVRATTGEVITARRLRNLF